MNKAQIFKKAHQAAARCVMFYRRKGETCNYGVTFAQALKNIYTEIKGKRSAKRIIDAGFGFENNRGEICIGRPKTNQKILSVGEFKTREWDFWSFYDLFRVRFSVSDCAMTFEEDTMQHFTEAYPRMIEQIKSIFEAHITEVSALIY